MVSQARNVFSRQHHPSCSTHAGYSFSFLYPAIAVVLGSVHGHLPLHDLDLLYRVDHLIDDAIIEAAASPFFGARWWTIRSRFSSTAAPGLISDSVLILCPWS